MALIWTRTAERNLGVSQTEFRVGRLHAFYYDELTRSLHWSKQKRNVWEAVFVVAGQADIHTSCGGRMLMSEGQFLLCEPDVLRAVHAADPRFPSKLMIFSFDFHAVPLPHLHLRLFRLEKEERLLLGELIQEGLRAFSNRGIQRSGPGAVSTAVPYGCEHLIGTYMELLFIRLLRRYESTAPVEPKAECLQASFHNALYSNDLVERIIDFMRSNLTQNLTMDDICDTFYISKTRLKKLFKESTGIGVMQCFNQMKIEEAKSIICEATHNYTEIAERLGYSSIHYFSNRFKKATGMPPTEYARMNRSKQRLADRTSDRWMVP